MKSENQSGRRIRVARNMHDPKWTQDDLLAKMHIRHNIVFTRNGISRIETGQRYVTDLELIAFCRCVAGFDRLAAGRNHRSYPKEKY